MNNLLKGQKLIYLSVAIFALLLVFGVFICQFGVSDNGELTNRLIHLGLYDCQAASGTGGFATKFGVSGNISGLTTADIPYAIAKLFHPVDSTVSVLIPAFIYCIFILLGFYLAIKNLFSKFNWNNMLLVTLSVFILGDTAYTSFLNTPYINAAQFAYLIFVIGSFIWATKTNKPIAIITAGISAVLFSGTSAITAWIGILLAIYFVMLLIDNKEILNKTFCVICIVLTLASSVYALASSPVDENKIYDSIFYGVALEDASEAVALGVDEETAKTLSGKASFDEAAQSYLGTNDLTENYSSAKVAMHYLKNPTLFVKNMKSVAANSTTISTDYLGNYKYGSAKANEQTGFFKLYSTFKRRLVPANFLISIIILLAVAVVSVYYRKKYASDHISKRICDLSVLCALAALLAFVLPLIYGGLVQIGFNMFLYNILFDLCLISACVGGTKLLWIRREALKEKYGVNQ